MIDSFSGDNRFLSNFWPCQVMMEGNLYSSVEHAYVAAKTIHPTVRSDIRALATPGKVKRFGKKLILRPGWNKMKMGYMINLVHYKFIHSPELMAMLVATGDQVLIEGNTWGDTYWGMCDGVGTNHLGRILMHLRDSPFKGI